MIQWASCCRFDSARGFTELFALNLIGFTKKTVGKYSSASIYSTESESPVRLGSDKNFHQWLEKHLY
jgi:hypothetical protein